LQDERNVHPLTQLPYALQSVLDRPQIEPRVKRKVDCSGRLG
jgi:hypothetical protein